MPLAHPQSDSEFNTLLANVRTTPLIVDFFASWFFYYLIKII